MTDMNGCLEKELREKYNPEGSLLRKAQLRMLDILKFIDKVCTENNITYWLDSGTLLGAERHGGFIPWDDDADICIPFEEMSRFKEIMTHNNPSGQFVFVDHDNEPGFIQPWAIIKDLKSEMFPDPKKNPIHYTMKYRGLGVDIFPVENHIINPLFRWCRSYHRKHITKPLLSSKKKYEKRKPFVEKHYDLLNNKYIPWIRAFSRHFKPKPYYRYAYGSIFKEKRYLKDIYPLKRMKFEGYEFMVPGNVDAYLTQTYGDWRQIPSEENRVTHNLTKIVIND